MKPSEYIEQSSRTAAAAKVNLDYFKNHNQVMQTTLRIIEAGHTADVLKRSLFYSDPKVEERAKKYDEEIAVFIEALKSDDNRIEISEEEINLLHAILGTASETAEILSEFLTALIEKRPVDKENLVEEAGDQNWYQAMLLRYLNTSFETVWTKNIDKLKARYPQRFTTDKALNRDLNGEKVALAG